MDDLNKHNEFSDLARTVETYQDARTRGVTK